MLQKCSSVAFINLVLRRFYFLKISESENNFKFITSLVPFVVVYILCYTTEIKSKNFKFSLLNKNVKIVNNFAFQCCIIVCIIIHKMSNLCRKYIKMTHLVVIS